MIVLVKDIKEANCITHSGTLHADEVFATAFLDLYLKDIKVCRTTEIAYEDIDKNAIIYDIGRGEFDHHQQDAKKRDNGTTYSSFGLLWQKYGRSYLEQENIENIEDVFLAIDKDFIEGIDADDNGIFPKIEADYRVKTISNIIKLFNPGYSSQEDENIQFMKAVTIAREILLQEIKTIIGKIKAKYKVIENLKNTAGNILILDEYMPYEETLLLNDLERKIYFVIFPSNRGGYNIKTVPKSNEDKTFRKEFPLEWASLINEELEKITGIPGSRFCHTSRFLLSCDTLETAYQLIDKALSSEINNINKNIDL